MMAHRTAIRLVLPPSLTVATLLACFSAAAFAVDPPRTVSEILDGTIYDVAASPAKVWLAQGRNLAVLDPATGRRLADDGLSPYPRTLVAVEYDGDGDTLIAATADTVYIHAPGGRTRTWSDGDEFGITDIKAWPAAGKLFVMSLHRLTVLDYRGDVVREVSHATPPADASYFLRLDVADVDGSVYAFVTAQMASERRRWKHGLVIVDLDSANGFARPVAYPSVWSPMEAYGDPRATVWDVAVIPNLIGDRDFAYVASGIAGQLTKLDITDPANPRAVGKIDLGVDSDGDGRRDYDVFKVLRDPARPRLYAASANLIHIVDPTTDTELGSQNVGFQDAGDRDMALIVYPDGRRHLWTGTHHQVAYTIKCIELTGGTPRKLIERWWMSSADGGVAVPEWHSIYLPTFGGVVRYDVTDEANPFPGDDSYRPARGTTEHIELMWPDPADRDHALLLSAPGSGGVQYWPISAADRNPGEPTRVVEKPAAWGADPVYQNDVASYQRGGVSYLLADLANRRTQEIALQAYNMSTGRWVNAFEGHPELQANSKDIYVFGDFAFVTCHGGFFVVRLNTLPERMEVVDEVIARLPGDPRPKTVASVAANPRGTHIFVATDGPVPKAIYSCPFDPTTGKVGEPVSAIISPDLPGSTAHLRYHAAADRFYIACRGGNLMEIDASDPTDLKHLSTWHNGGYSGEMQDCNVYDFGNGPRVLAVKNNEFFAILDPDDGL